MPSLLGLVVCSLDIKRYMYNIPLTTLPEGIFEGLTALIQL